MHNAYNIAQRSVPSKNSKIKKKRQTEKMEM